MSVGVVPSALAAPPLHAVGSGIDEVIALVLILVVLGYIFLTSRRRPKQ